MFDQVKAKLNRSIQNARMLSSDGTGGSALQDSDGLRDASTERSKSKIVGKAMSAVVASNLVFFLGFIGLASVGLICVRSWQISILVFRRDAQKTSAVSPILVILLTAGLLWWDAKTTVQIFKCLTETYCGPSSASGWAYLALLGAIYLALELLILLIRKLGWLK